MKERELRDHATCSLCREKILSPAAAGGLPLFWRVTVERFGVDLRAVERQQGLTMLLGGNATIAAAMGPDEEMTQPLMEPLVLTICERCGTAKDYPVAALVEVGGERRTS